MEITKTKKWLLSILVILLGVILLIIYTPKEQYFNEINLNNDNFVRNTTEISYLDTIIKVGLDELELKQVVVFTRGITIEDDREDFELIAHIKEGLNNVYLLEINKKSRNDMIGIVSHELIHLRQLYTNRLVVASDYIIWKTDTIYDI